MENIITIVALKCALKKNKQKPRRGMYDQQVFRAVHNYVTNLKTIISRSRVKFMREEETNRVIFIQFTVLVFVQVFVLD